VGVPRPARFSAARPPVHSGSSEDGGDRGGHRRFRFRKI